jgi:DNA-directed RNA polymerase subunit RPC12/RpoP
VARYKRTVCPTCGAPKERPSATAYVYCDYCGSLADYDFAKACEVPLQRPGPVYETLAAALRPEIDAAMAARDEAACRAVHARLFDAWVAASPSSVPPRAREATYRARYVAYLAEGAVVTAFDATAQALQARVTEATSRLAFYQDGTHVRVHPRVFAPFVDAVFAQLDHAAILHEARGVYAMQPDGASAELQQRIGCSLFAQGWLPMLDESSAIALLERTKLRVEYVDTDAVAADASCRSCGAPVPLLAGAKRVVCESCGNVLDAVALMKPG